ncbi:hypothetical protein [Clostridium sp.]|uniref:hypothetical protein n=1 Tax=Clostridium sp. TaxID=1506 RepID=UPI00359FE966
MAYPQEIDKFTEKLNKLDNNTYVIEEVATLTNGVYEGELEHDNVSLPSINVYTGSKLTGTKIENVIVSTPSLTPWKNTIKIFSDVSPVYITYQTQGDTVEAEDINKVQDSIVNTQIALNTEKDRAIDRENTIEDNLNTEISRAEQAENTLTNNLNTEINRAKNREDTIEGNLNSEISRAESAENTLAANLNAEINRANNVENTLTNNLNSEITRAAIAENTINNTISSNKPNWDDKYTKNEVDNKISQVISNMDWKESVATYADIATTYPNPEDGWTVNVKDTDITYRYNGTEWIAISANSIPLATSSVDGKMSKQDKIDHDDMNSKKHTHNNLSILQTITQALIDTWNTAYTHISDAVKHITSTERTLWNTVSNKVDKITGKSLSTNDFDNTYKSKVDGISIGANKVEQSTTNGNIKIDGAEKTVYSHPGNGTNPHGTTKNDVGLGNVTNDAQVKRTEMGANSGVATLDSSGVNTQPPKTHSHTKSQISDFPDVYTKNEIDAIKIGGRNLILNTGTTISKTGSGWVTSNWILSEQMVTGDYIISFKYTITVADAIGISLGNSSGAYDGSYELATTLSSGTDIYYSKSVHFTRDEQTNLAFYTNQTITISELKLEKGDKATDWSPAPEDIQNQLEGKSNTGHTHDDRYFTESEANNTFATKDEISNAGYGDMLKSVYDTNNNGIVDKAEDSNTIGGLHANNFGRPYSSSYPFGDSQAAITTADFITLLNGLGAFSQPYWVARGSWAYAYNKYISDTGIGNIHLAGCTVEVIGNSSNYTIRIHTPTTTSDGTINTEYIYVNNGGSYSPGWRKIWNDKNDGPGSGLDADLLDGSHANSFVPKGCTWNDLKGV